MENNSIQDKLYWIYRIGFLMILALPMLVIPPYFFPPDWGKTIVFRSIMAILLFLFIWQLLYKRNEIAIPHIKKNNIVWILALFFIAIILSTLFSQDVNFSLWGSPYRAGGSINLLLYILFAIISFLIIKKQDWNKVIHVSFFVGMLVSLVAIIQLYELFSNIFISVPGRPPSTMGNPILLGIYLLLLFFVTLPFAIKEKRRNYKLWYCFALLLFLYVMLTTGSRAVYLGLLFGGLYFILWYPIINKLPKATDDSKTNNLVSNGVSSKRLSEKPVFALFPEFLAKKFAIISRLMASINLKILSNFRSRIWGISSKEAFQTTSKKIRTLKMITIVCLMLGVFTIYYVNSNTQFPKFLENNKVFQAIQPRLSLKLALAEPRFSIWKVGFWALKEKPLLGFGPENFAIGFDKNYSPSLPYINKDWGSWWDRPHNILLDIATTTGVPSLIIYLTLFIALFWRLQKLKSAEKNVGAQEAPYIENTLIVHGVQATLIAYLVANIFSFDGFSSYLMFFLLIGYSLHLTSSDTIDSTLIVKPKNTEIKNPYKSIIISVLICGLIWFLWQYNLKPFQINGQIQKANFLSENKKCNQAFTAMDNILPQHSFLDAYARVKYVEYLITCAEVFPKKNLAYAQRGVELMKEAVTIRPLYSRLWIFLGRFTTIKANAEKDLGIKKNLIEEANFYFKKASQLAPNHQEILIEQAKTNMVAQDYQAMRENALQCIALDSSLSDCYWIKGTAEIYLKNFQPAKKDIETALQKTLGTPITSFLYLLVNAYTTTENYKELANVYEKLIEINATVPEYHSSLAFAYAKTGEYKKARKEAMRFLELMPEAKEEVEAFLKTLPY